MLSASTGQQHELTDLPGQISSPVLPGQLRDCAVRLQQISKDGLKAVALKDIR